MIGVRPQLVLPWPLNALISLMQMGAGGLSVWASAMLFVQQWGKLSYVIPCMGFMGLSIALVALLHSRWLLRGLGQIERPWGGV